METSAPPLSTRRAGGGGRDFHCFLADSGETGVPSPAIAGSGNPAAHPVAHPGILPEMLVANRMKWQDFAA
jgi:hypothetical protein